MTRAVRIGSRRSALARVQAQHVAAVVRAAAPALELEYCFIESSGDRSTEPSAARVTARGGFTEDLGTLLDRGEIDIAVHSWKDLPLRERAATEVVATLPRADARDVLLLRRDAVESATDRGLRILSSSARRRHHLEQFLAWALPLRPARIEFAPVRGDIATRLYKLLRGDGDALVIAKAALDRLLDTDLDLLAETGAEGPARLRESQAIVRTALAACRVMVLPLASSPAAPAQGALAIEVRRDSPLRELLQAINHRATFETVQAERALALELGEDEPLGVTRLRMEFGDVEFVRGTHAGTPFERVTLYRHGASLPRPASADALWTEPPGRAQWREALHDAPRDFGAGQGLLVARSEALPQDSRISPDTIIWTAGLVTWRKLAQRGLWVVGSDESLGESGAVGVRSWFPQARQWLKLSHSGGHASDIAAFVPTYRTGRSEPLARVDRYSHFFWNSGTQLREYLQAFPGLRHAWHGCGPGNTYRIARDLLGAERLRPFLDAAQFRTELLA